MKTAAAAFKCCVQNHHLILSIREKEIDFLLEETKAPKRLNKRRKETEH
jgi:hypothetical protein